MTAGIDYGLGKTNIDTETGIRYGVIPHSAVGQSWYEDAEAVYSPEARCQKCGTEIGLVKDVDFGTPCKDCGEKWDGNENEEALGFKYEREGIKAFQTGEVDIFVEKSPFYTLCRFCSPCAPGAGYLKDADDEGIKAYCLPHDWFEGGKAPYRVFRVENDEEVLAK